MLNSKVERRSSRVRVIYDKLKPYLFHNLFCYYYFTREQELIVMLWCVDLTAHVWFGWGPCFNDREGRTILQMQIQMQMQMLTLT
jgi:hypothetical protein